MAPPAAAESPSATQPLYAQLLYVFVGLVDAALLFAFGWYLSRYVHKRQSCPDRFTGRAVGRVIRLPDEDCCVLAYRVRQRFYAPVTPALAAQIQTWMEQMRSATGDHTTLALVFGRVVTLPVWYNTLDPSTVSPLRLDVHPDPAQLGRFVQTTAYITGTMREMMYDAEWTIHRAVDDDQQEGQTVVVRYCPDRPRDATTLPWVDEVGAGDDRIATQGVVYVHTCTLCHQRPPRRRRLRRHHGRPAAAAPQRMRYCSHHHPTLKKIKKSCHRPAPVRRPSCSWWSM